MVTDCNHYITYTTFIVLVWLVVYNYTHALRVFGSEVCLAVPKQFCARHSHRARYSQSS